MLPLQKYRQEPVMLTRDGQVRKILRKQHAKAKCTVNKNITLYAVQKKAVQLTFHRCDGSTWQKTTLAKGSSYSLPGVRDAEGYTFMGWSTKSNAECFSAV